MQYRNFGNTGLRVSIIGFGGAAIWGDPSTSPTAPRSDISDPDLASLLNSILDAGVNLFDTAGMYGLSEQRIGRTLAPRRSEFFLSSKCGYDNLNHEDWSAAAITNGIDRSLRDLRTDHIDIMHLHSCDLDVLKNGEAIDALLRAVAAGKVRFPAYSGDNDELLWAIDSCKFASIQTSINICDQRAIDAALSRCIARNLGVIAKRPIANAFWTHETQPTGEYCEEYWKRARAINLKPDPLSWNELAIRFTAHQLGVSSCIIGTKNLDHFRDNLAAVANGPLPADVVAKYRSRFRDCDSNWLGEV